MKILEYENYIILKYKGVTQVQAGFNGVGFMIQKALKHHIMDFTAISDRVVRLDLSIENVKINCIQVRTHLPKKLQRKGYRNFILSLVF